MKVSPLLSLIFRKHWLMSSKEISAYEPMLNLWLTQGVEAEKEDDKPFCALMLSNDDPVPRTFKPGQDVAPGSVAIINLSGTMIKESDWCMYGTEEIAQAMIEAVQNKNCIGTIIKIDSGGGTSDSVNPMVEAIKFAQDLNKSVVALVDSAACSAAYWVAAHCDEIIMSNNMAEVGSIGVYIRFNDFSKNYEERGIKQIEIYAPQSDEKNRPYRDALAGKFELMQNEVLKPMADEFISVIKAARPKATDPLIFSGKVFYAKDAVANGLADRIGNLQMAVDSIKSKSNSTSNFSNQNFRNMKGKQFPIAAAALGVTELEEKDGKVSLNADQVSSLQSEYRKRTGKEMPLKGMSFDEDGSAELSTETLIDLNAEMSEAIMTADASAQTIKEQKLENEKTELQNKVDKMANTAEEPKVVTKKVAIIGGGAGSKPAFLVKLDNLERPWNMAAAYAKAGNSMSANHIIEMTEAETLEKLFTKDLETFRESFSLDVKSIFAASELDITKVNTDLGGYHREQGQLMSMLYPSDDLGTIFPYISTGLRDELVNVDVFAEEFLQPANEDWAEKGGFKLSPEIIKVRDWQISHRFKFIHLRQFIKSWLAMMTTSSDPYQPGLVQYFVQEMMKKVAVERVIGAVKGKYVVPVAGTAGKAINAVEGLLSVMQSKIRENKILVTRVGVGNYEHLDASGNVNKNHVYFKQREVFKSIPKDLREAFQWVSYVSSDDKKEMDRFENQVILQNANFAEAKRAENYDNLTFKVVPYLPDGIVLISVAGNIRQFYRAAVDDNRVTFMKDMRDTIVHMDGAYAISPLVTGYPYADYASLLASKGINQRIFTNGEFGAYTSIPLAANATKPDFANHNILETVANTGATVIADFDNVAIGQIVYLIGGSSTNASSIASNNAKFIGLTANLVLNAGVIAKFQKVATDKYVLLEMLTDGVQTAIEFAADDATPSVAGGKLFVTSKANTDGNAAITGFDGATVGVPFKVIGGGGTYPSTIANSGNFAMTEAKTFAAGTTVTLMLRGDGNFVEII